jgi:hypothetical protein
MSNVRELFEVPRDPVELAAPEAAAMTNLDFATSQAEETLLASLEHAANNLGFLGKRYFLHAHTGFQIPSDIAGQERVTYTRFDGLTAEVELTTYAKVHIGRFIGGGAVRAICLCFTEGFVLNRFSDIPDDQVLYVPVLAIDEIAEAA